MMTGFPVPLDNDSEDVVWGLTTGGALWRQGEQHDAIVWLKRAVHAATDAGAGDRAEQLNGAATQLIGLLTTSSPSLPAAAALPAERAVSTPSPIPPPPARSSPADVGRPSVSGAPRGKPPPPPPRARAPHGAPPPLPNTSAQRPRRDDTPSVTTSAPRISALELHAPEEQHVRHESPPPPTIIPDVALATIPPLSSLPSVRTPAPLRPSEPVPLAGPLAGPLGSALRAIEGLSEAQRRALADSAKIEQLTAEEELTVSGLALVLDGEVGLGAAITDIAAARLRAGEVVLGRGSIPDPLPLRLVAESSTATVATWDQRAISESLADAPELIATWTRDADRLHALAGSTIGAVGERLDQELRTILFERLEARAFGPGATVAQAGLPVPGIVVVGVGSLELDRDGETYERLGPGDFLFATEILGQAPAPARARAGAKGAVVLLGARATTYDLLMSCPPLLEIFAGS